MNNFLNLVLHLCGLFFFFEGKADSVNASVCCKITNLNLDFALKLTRLLTANKMCICFNTFPILLVNVCPLRGLWNTVINSCIERNYFLSAEEQFMRKYCVAVLIRELYFLFFLFFGTMSKTLQ